MSTTASSTAGAQAWFGRAVFGLDVWLRRLQGVFEYSSSPDCIFRLKLTRLQHPVELTDGTRFSVGDEMAMLHLWNEQIPLLPPRGATLQWARRFDRQFDLSLRQLFAFLDKRSDLRNIKAVHAQLTLGTSDETEQQLRIMSRYGFVGTPGGEILPTSVLGKLRRHADNVFIALLVLARNPRAFRFSRWRRSRVDIYLPRAVFDARYGSEGRR